MWNMDLWTPGKAPIIGKESNGAPIYARTDILEVPGKDGGKVHSNILSAPTILGDERVRDYYKHNNIDVANRVTRSEKDGVSLQKLATTTKQINKNRNDEIAATTLTAKKDIQKLLTIDQIIAKIGELRELEHNVTIPPLPSRSSKNHAGWAEFLSKQRKAVFNNKPLMKQELTNAIMNKYKSQEVSTKEQRAELLQHKFYSLSKTICDDSRYTTKHDVSIEPEPLELDPLEC